MGKPIQTYIGKARKNSEKIREKYLADKDEYLELCWQYNLPPRDLTLLLMGDRDIVAEDRIRLIRLVISLSDMERDLGPKAVSDTLFPKDESCYSHSVMFEGDYCSGHYNC